MADGTGSTLQAIAPIAGAIPYVGPIVSAGLSIAGGAMAASDARKQAEEAAKIRNNALRLRSEQTRKEFAQKLTADRMAALGDSPGYATAKNDLSQRIANQIRAIRSTSNSGDTTVNAISNAIYAQNQATNQLSARNMAFRAGTAQTARNTLWDVGEQGNRMDDRRDQWKREGLTAASSLENASMANRMGAFNQISGAIGSTIGNIEGNAAKANTMQAIYNALYGQQKSTSPTLTMTPDANDVWGYQSNIQPSYQTPTG